MKRSFWMFLLMLSAAACSARGGGGGGLGPDDDASTDDVATDDTPATPDAPVTPDAPAPDAPVTPDAPPPDMVATGCTRDSECTGSTWCDTSTGMCMPIVCTPGRASCVSASRARVCNDRGSMFTEMDCPGGCTDGVCTGGMTTCTAPRMMCEGTCVDTSSNPANCGRCFNACAAGQTCSSGVCTGGTTCGRPLVSCGGACVNTQTDARNCGACGVACATGQTCSSGVCTGGTVTCAAPLTRCGTACVDTQGDPANCGACGRACAAGQGCSAGACVTLGAGPSLRIMSLGTSGCMVRDHDAVTSDDRGGIAVGSSSMFYSGDTSTGRFDLDSLTATAVGRIYDGLASNLRTGTVYDLATASGPLVDSISGATVTSLVELDGVSGAPTTRTVALSMPLVLGTGTGIFSGWDRVVIASSSHVYNVDLPSGRVTDLGPMVFPSHMSCESWAFWGVAEYFDGRVHLSYVEGSTRIARVRVPDGTVTTVGTFTNLSDMCSFTVSPLRGRWYFHHESSSQFGGTYETAGYCPAVISAGGTVTCSAPTVLCGSDCVDTSSDAANCGACGRACAAGQACRTGACTTVTTGPNYARTVPPSSVTFTEVCGMAGATRVLTSTDDGSVFAPLPFTFNFWGAPLPAGRMVNISSNGFLSLDGVASNSLGDTIPSSSTPNGVVATFWRDLRTGTSGVCHATLGSAPYRRFIAEWSGTYLYGGTSTQSITTEIVLNESDGAIDILTQSNTMPSGTTATVGVENLTGTRSVGGCTGTTATCTNPSGNRVRFAPAP